MRKRQHSIKKSIESFFSKIGNFITAWSIKKFLFILIVIQIILHLPVIPLSPMGQHTWRQVAGLSQAKNYYEENNNFFYPRMDIRVGKTDQGIIYKEFPSLYWLIGQSYRLTGFHHANGRIIQLIIAIFLIIGSYRFCRAIGVSDHTARWYTFFLSFSPYFFYYSITVIPDFLALTFFLWGISLLLLNIAEEKWSYTFWLGVILILLATLTKASWLFFGISLAYIFIAQFIKTKKYHILILGFLVGVLILTLNGIQYIHQLNLWHQAPPERAFETTLSFKPFPTDVSITLTIIKKAAFTWFLEFFVNTAVIPLFLAGIWYGFKNKKYKSYSGKFWLAWLISFFIYFVLFFVSFGDDGGYYLTPILPFAALVSTYGVINLIQNKKWRPLIVLIILITPLVMVGRVYHRWTTSKQVPVELLYRAEEIQNFIPKNERVIIIGDKSPIVYLYYIQRKGLAVEKSVSRERMTELIDAGFKWLVCSVEVKEISQLKGLILPVGNVGNFSIYMLSKKGVQ